MRFLHESDISAKLHPVDRNLLPLLPRIRYDYDEVHHFFDADDPIVILVGQPEDLCRHAPGGQDLVEGLWIDGVVCANEVGDGFQQLHDVRLLVVGDRDIRVRVGRVGFWPGNKTEKGTEN